MVLACRMSQADFSQIALKFGGCVWRKKHKLHMRQLYVRMHCTVVGEHEDATLFRPHSVVQPIQPCGENGRRHPCLLAEVIVNAQRLDFKPIETQWFLRISDDERLQFLTGRARCQQRCDSVFHILPTVAGIALHHHRLRWHRSEEHSRLICVEDVLCFVTVAEDWQTLPPLSHGFLRDIHILAVQDRAPDVLSGFPPVEPSIRSGEVVISIVHRQQDGFLLDHDVTYGDVP